jgi:hypothetical protein
MTLGHNFIFSSALTHDYLLHVTGLLLSVPPPPPPPPPRCPIATGVAPYLQYSIHAHVERTATFGLQAKQHLLCLIAHRKRVCSPYVIS